MTVSIRPYDLVSKPAPTARVIVAQIGARMHYAVPQAFHRLGMLQHFYTFVQNSVKFVSIVEYWQ